MSKAIGKSESSRRLDEALRRVIEGSLTIVIDNAFRKRNKGGVCNCVLARWRRVTKVNCRVAACATTTNAEKSISTETCPEIAVYLLSRLL